MGHEKEKPKISAQFQRLPEITKLVTDQENKVSFKMNGFTIEESGMQQQVFQVIAINDLHILINGLTVL